MPSISLNELSELFVLTNGYKKALENLFIVVEGCFKPHEYHMMESSVRKALNEVAKVIGQERIDQLRKESEDGKK